MAKIVNDPTLQALQQKIRETLNARSNFLLDGGCKDFPEYRYMTGVLEGLGLAEDELLVLDKQMTAD